MMLIIQTLSLPVLLCRQLFIQRLELCGHGDVGCDGLFEFDDGLLTRDGGTGEGFGTFGEFGVGVE